MILVLAVIFLIGAAFAFGSGMFTGLINLRQLTLDEHVTFVGHQSSSLHLINPSDKFTGFWQNVGNGTVTDPLGIHVLTSEELMSMYDGSTMADTFVWQPEMC